MSDKCCNNMCRQGRDCPNRNEYHFRFYNLIEFFRSLFKKS